MQKIEHYLAFKFDKSPPLAHDHPFYRKLTLRERLRLWWLRVSRRWK